jgi:hypothetical protein
MMFLRNGVQVASVERHPGLHERDDSGDPQPVWRRAMRQFKR